MVEWYMIANGLLLLSAKVKVYFFITSVILLLQWDLHRILH